MYVDNWHRVPILLNLDTIVVGGTFDNLTTMIICFLVIFGGILEINIVNKVLCFGVNSVIVFHGLNIGVIVQLINKQYPFIVKIHCMAHRCNLVV